MRSRAVAAIEIVEVAYRAACSAPSSWLEQVLEAARPLLDQGSGVFAYEYDTNRPYPNWLSRPIVAGAEQSLSDGALAAFLDAPFEISDFIHRRAGRVTILSELLGMMPRDHAQLGPHSTSFDVADMFGVNASDPSGRGAYLCAPAKQLLSKDDIDAVHWEQLAAHLAASGRLRGVLSTHPVPEAVLSPDGRVLHASPAAERGLSSLSLGAKNIERARRRAERADPNSLASWRALVEGRWSLVDVVESDGRRFLFAHPNAPTAPDPRRLTPLQRTIAGYVAIGHSNKLIAYELGLAIGTVSSHLNVIFKKLGVGTRVELVDRVRLLSQGSTTQIKIAGEPIVVVAQSEASASAGNPLTKAELAVARLAARGLSNASIARRQRVSPRTIANQLASIFDKLGVSSRSELALTL